MRTTVYVDGFNMYYGCLKGTKHKWLDLCALFARCLPAPHVLDKVKYFTARVSALPTDPHAPLRQQTYLAALKAHCGGKLEIIEGHFQIKPKYAPLERTPTTIVKILNTEEKGSDVNLAVELVNDAWLNRFDCGVVVSNDGDLARALRIVKKDIGKRVILMTPGGFNRVRTPSASLTRWAHKQKDINPADLAACQLPDQIPNSTLSKPATW